MTLEGMDEILDRLKELGQRATPAENQALYMPEPRSSRKTPAKERLVVLRPRSIWQTIS
jgi:hypothetical protein